MAAPRRYPDELRERTVRMAVDARKDPPTEPGALARIGGQLGAARMWSAIDQPTTVRLNTSSTAHV